MPIKLKSTGGGSVTLDVPSTGTDFTLTLPANNATLVSSAGASLSNTVLSGNTAISGASSYLNINGINVSQYSGMMKNRIINGDFRIDQRFNGAANNNLANAYQYVVDRWMTYGAAAGKLRFQQNNTNGPGSSSTQLATGFSNYFGANVVSSNTVNSSDIFYMLQPVEGFNTADLNWGTAVASPVTLSFWTYSSIAGTHGGALANVTADRTYPFTYTINTANTWQYQTITVPGDTTGNWFSNNNVGMYVIYSLGIGSTYDGTNNSWNAGSKYPTGVVKPVSAANGSFYLTGVQLEKGSQATAFDFRHYTTELQLCQRYYESTAFPSVTFGLSDMRTAVVLSVPSYATGFNYLSVKRTAPNTTLYSRNGNAGKTSLLSTGGDISGTSSVPNGNATGFWGITLGSVQTAGVGVECGWTASAELGTQN